MSRLSAIYSGFLIFFLFYLSGPARATARLHVSGVAADGVSTPNPMLHVKAEKLDLVGSKGGDGAVRSSGEGLNAEMSIDGHSETTSTSSNSSSGMVPKCKCNNNQPYEGPGFLSDYALPTTRPPSHN